MHATYDGLIGTFGVIAARFRQTKKQKGTIGATVTLAKLATYVLLTPVYAYVMGSKTFRFKGKNLKYFCHWYNTTFMNERAVEVAVAMDMLKEYEGKRILEVGNVLSHYTSHSHDVLDKYEKGKGVIHEDVIDYRPSEKYDVIMSISTLEHVGFDEYPRDKTKFVKAVQHLKSLLKTGGQMFVTIPVRYNTDAVRDVCEKDLFSTLVFLKHRMACRWEEVSMQEALATEFNEPFQFANAVIFCMEE